MNNKLTIVIPCKNEEAYIVKLFQSLLKQTYDIRQTSIIVADAQSTDRTRAVIEAFKQQHQLNIQIVEGGYPAVGRNRGAQLATSEYLLFLDADVELHESNFIEKLIEFADENNLDAVGTLVKTKNGNWLDRFIWMNLTLFMHVFAQFRPFSTGMTIFVRRNVFEDLGGFDESMILGEDVELTSKFNASRFKVLNIHILTSNRRFKESGYFRTMLLYTKIFASKKFRRRNNSFYFRASNNSN